MERKRTASRHRVTRYVWIVLGLVALGAVLVLGTGTGSSTGTGTGNPVTNVVFPALLPTVGWLRRQGSSIVRPRRYHQ